MDRNLSREEIRSQMAAIRGNLDGEVGGIVRNARRLVDWRYYVRSFPWSSLAAAAAAGYLLVPRAPRRIAVQNIASDANPRNTQEKAAEAAATGGLLGTLAGLATNFAMKMALQYAQQQFKSRWSQNGSAHSVRTVEP